MYLNRKLTIRLHTKVLEEIEFLVEKDFGLTWESESHFVRCAINHLLRDLEKKK